MSKHETAFAHLDGRTEACSTLRSRAYALAGGAENYISMPYAKKSLLQRAAFQEYIVEYYESRMLDDEASKLTQAVNALHGLYKTLGLVSATP